MPPLVVEGKVCCGVHLTKERNVTVNCPVGQERFSYHDKPDGFGDKPLVLFSDIVMNESGRSLHINTTESTDVARVMQIPVGS